MVKQKTEQTASLGGAMIGKAVFLVLFLAVLAGFVWSYTSYHKAKKQIVYLSTSEAQQEVAQKEVEELINKVKRLIVLPEGQPVLATITDVENLSQQQPFFSAAKNGDKLLIYPTKAVIYNPDDDILVNVGPVTIVNQQGEVVQPLPPQPQTVSLDVRNGSETVGAASVLAGTLGSNDQYDVVNAATAANTEYQGTTLVNLTGKDVSALEQELGVTAVTVLPEGEAVSQADVVIIVGN